MGNLAKACACAGTFSLLAIGARVLAAQAPGSMAADRARLAELTGDTAQLLSAGDRLRDVFPFFRGVPVASGDWIRVVRPEVRFTYNSAIPFSLNDGPMWAGRGRNASVSTGLSLQGSYKQITLRLTLAPTVAYSENRPFDLIPDTTIGRYAFANPFHGAEAPMDIPLRFGDQELKVLDPGRSAIELVTKYVALGATAAPEWWGPGIRNALVLSNNAPGIPRWFVGTARPIRTPAGSIDARLIAGTLTQSLYFDSLLTRPHRTLSGVRVQIRPAFDSMLTLGIARAVYAPIGDSLLAHATLVRSFDAVTRWEYVGPDQHADQITSLFARWVFPAAGLEVYTEWAKSDLPRRLTELLLASHDSRAYTVGLQWAQKRRAHDYLRLQTELSTLEQSAVIPDRPPRDFYTARRSDQGYTQRGQVIGAATGPGSSAQWIALDYLAREWQAGAFVGRIRWDNDALYRQPVATFFRHDVTTLSGVRGGWRSAASDFMLELTVGSSRVDLQACKLEYSIVSPK